MLVLGIVFLIIIVIFTSLFLYRRLSTEKRYIKTVGQIIDVKNMVPLVDKRQVAIGGNYVYTECRYHGDAYVTVRFINSDGEELTRRYTSSEPFYLKINEHKRSVTQYTSVFPEWQIGKSIKIFYDPGNTLDIVVGRRPLKNRASHAL